MKIKLFFADKNERDRINIYSNYIINCIILYIIIFVNTKEARNIVLEAMSVLSQIIDL